MSPENDDSKVPVEGGMTKSEILWAMGMIVIILGLPIVAVLWGNCIMLEEIC